MRALFVSLVLLAACSHSATGPAADPYVAGVIIDSISPASRMYQSPWWVLFVYYVGPDALHSGVSYQGTMSRDEPRRYARCLGPFGQLPGERQLKYVALGDTLYSADSAAFWPLINHIGINGNDARASLDSAVSGLIVRLPGLAVIATAYFDPTVSAFGRGASPETAIIRRWQWTDAGVTFSEADTLAAAQPCLSIP